jgi:hypothetical protein
MSKVSFAGQELMVVTNLVTIHVNQEIVLCTLAAAMQVRQ